MKLHVRPPRLKRRSSRSEIGHLKSKLFGGAGQGHRIDGPTGTGKTTLLRTLLPLRELSRPNRVHNWTRYERPGIRRSRAVGRSESSKEVLDFEARGSRHR